MDVIKFVYIVRWLSLRHLSKITKRELHFVTYQGKKIMESDASNDMIYNAIKQGIPFMAGRYGVSEFNAIWKTKNDNSGFDLPIKNTLKNLHEYSGFFPEEEEACLKFAAVMKESSAQVDLAAVWFHPMECYVLRKWGGAGTKFCTLRGIEPFFATRPWTKALEGKKVLIIHPFSDTIISQYEKRDMLFSNKKILPEFQLRVQKAIQTIAGNKDVRFANWFEALEYMYEEAIKIDFDVAILGCGAYGFPLAAKLKKAGKVAIHMGGSTQLLFGIRGKRWDERKDYQQFINEYWVRSAEKPENAEKVENGCYW